MSNGQDALREEMRRAIDDGYTPKEVRDVFSKFGYPRVCDVPESETKRIRREVRRRLKPKARSALGMTREQHNKFVVGLAVRLAMHSLLSEGSKREIKVYVGRKWNDGFYHVGMPGVGYSPNHWRPVLTIRPKVKQ